MLVFAVLLLFYPIPSIIGFSRGARSSLGIFVLNILLGWTVLGWICAFIWASSGETKAQAVDRADYQRIIRTLQTGTLPALAPAQPAAQPSRQLELGTRIGRRIRNLRERF